MIESGSAAPDFALSDQDGNVVRLEDLRGQTSVLVFYPMDWSPVCTDQLNVYQEVLADLEGEGAHLYGVFIEERGHNQRALVMIGPDLVVRWAHQSPTPLEIPGANLIFDALAAHAAA